MLESLRLEVQRAYGCTIRASRPLTGGDEADVWRVDIEDGHLVVHVGPSWRTDDELRWVHALVSRCAVLVPEAVAPLRCVDGDTILRHDGRPVTVFAYVEGEMLDRDDPGLRTDAARLLARIHRALAGWPHGDRPPGADDAPQAARVTDPQELRDPEIDAVGRTVVATGPVHGDYYRRNILCREGRIVGVIDWHEASVAPLIGELAFAAWEMCHDDEHTFLEDRATAFVSAYRDAGGPVPARELDLLMPFMRLRIREDVRYNLARAKKGQPIDEDYVAKQIRAFTTLGRR